MSNDTTGRDDHSLCRAALSSSEARRIEAESESTRLRLDVEDRERMKVYLHGILEGVEVSPGSVPEGWTELVKKATRLRLELAERSCAVKDKADEIVRLREREKVLVERVVKELRGRGDTAYMNGVAWSRQTECLGWEQKAKEGRFGKPEMDAHKRFNEYMGAHFALHEAARVLAALSAEPEGKEKKA